MCGRINVSDHEGIQQLLNHLGIPFSPQRLVPRFNIAPGADILVAFQADAPDLAQMHWGLLPAWARNKPGARPLINARVETAWDKPSFKKLVRATRAIIPINGFYEWQRSNDGKTPYYIRPANTPAMALAGIYQVSPDGILEVAILTRESRGDMAKIHHRQPVTLSPKHFRDWLVTSAEPDTRALLESEPDPDFDIRQVSSYVNNAANDGSQCMEPVAA